MSYFVEYESQEKITVGFVSSSELNQSVIKVIPLRTVNDFASNLPCLLFDPLVSGIALQQNKIIRIVVVKLLSYFENGLITYHKGMGMYCVASTELTTAGEFSNLFRIHRLEGRLSEDIYMDSYFEKSEVIRSSCESISRAKSKGFVKIKINKISVMENDRFI